MRHRLFIPAATALLFALAACTQDELADDNRLPEGEYPVVIRATGLSVEATPQAAPSTRATVDGDWQGVQTVALKMGDAVKEYTVTATDADGYKSATLSRTDDPHYWTSRDPITVSAWWPIDKADITRMPAVKVAEDQSTLAAFQGSDFISAIDRTVEFDDPKLTFTHRTARVAIELKPGTGFTSVDGATVSLVSLSTDNENPTAIKTYHASGNSYEALTAPQTVAKGEPFIRVELGGGNFYFRPQNDVVLEAGNRYTYTVKVNATGLTLEGCTIGGWEPGQGESGAAEDLGYNYDTTTKTYTVYNADGLLAWNEAARKDLSFNCTLTADINLTGKEWMPIGDGSTSANSYQGTFDGQGHRITGLAITTDNPRGESAALFNGIGDNGEVKNLQLVDVDYDVKQGGASGGIAWSNYGTITACSVTGTIAAANGGVGGIATSNIGTITACWFKGSITGYRFAGGIAAFNYNDVSACYWNGNVSSGIPSGTNETTEVNDGDSWQPAVNGMNAALTGNGYQWALGKDGLPVLQKKQ
ncbi:fimbrillin family protein [Barnesiella intestinihominis]|uniref:fimbrillin family protein n=1 Tax=Barnesiella intestinihominis TaxID=487174 RepID=UPI00189B0959|nr:fimbrillin family protein [Barnesiella intestinihominis]MDB0677186.1 fimbrillin family protein [Barnesiella intestinihominis]